MGKWRNLGRELKLAATAWRASMLSSLANISTLVLTECISRGISTKVGMMGHPTYLPLFVERTLLKRQPIGEGVGESPSIASEVNMILLEVAPILEAGGELKLNKFGD